MEAKWMSILCIGVAAAMFTPLGIMEYSKSQCQIEGIRAGLTDTVINNICGKSR